MTDNTDTPQRATVEYLQQQRAAGWPDVHPEDYCHKCGNRNVSWWVDSDVWNAVMDSATSPYHGILCPSCFGERFEERYPDTAWELRLSEDTRGARAFRAENPAGEKALTPTDDEREALEEALKYLDTLNADRQIWYDDYRNLHDLVSAGFRRSVVPEPSAELLSDWFTSSHGVAVAAVKPMTDRGPSVMVDGRVISPNDVAAIVEFKAQGEPSDAQVEAAHKAFWEHPDITGGPDSIRAALRAASKTGGAPS